MPLPLLDCSLCWFLGVAGHILVSPCNRWPSCSNRWPSAPARGCPRKDQHSQPITVSWSVAPAPPPPTSPFACTSPLPSLHSHPLLPRPAICSLEIRADQADVVQEGRGRAWRFPVFAVSGGDARVHGQGSDAVANSLGDIAADSWRSSTVACARWALQLLLHGICCQ